MSLPLFPPPPLPPPLMHGFGYAQVRPVTPNPLGTPLGLAPGATVNVFLTTTQTAATIFADPAGATPLANPFVADANAFFSFYLTPVAVDVRLSGGGILSPYTLANFLGIDPGTINNATALASQIAKEASDVAGLQGQITTLTHAGINYHLGGSITRGIEFNAQTPAIDAVTLSINGSTFVGFTATVTATIYTGNAGTGVQAVLQNLTLGTQAGISASITALTPTVVTFSAALAAGANLYQLQVLPANNSAFVFAEGYLSLTK